MRKHTYLSLLLMLQFFVFEGRTPIYSEKFREFYQSWCVRGLSSSEKQSPSEVERGALAAGLGGDEQCPSRCEARAYLAWCRPCHEGQAPAEANGDTAVSGWLSENLVACQE